MEPKIYKITEEESTFGSFNATSSDISIIGLNASIAEPIDQYPDIKTLVQNTFTQSNNHNQIFQVLREANLLQYSNHIHNQLYIGPNIPLDLGKVTKARDLMDVIVADKKYSIPRSSKGRLIVPYRECSPLYDANILTNTNYPWLIKHTEELHKTISTATEILKPLRGRVVKYDLVLLMLVVIVLPLICILSVVCGMYLSYWVTVGLLISFALCIAIFLSITKIRSKSFLKWSSICVSFYLRAENNRYYIKNGIMLRPGCLGKWIEVCAMM